VIFGVAATKSAVVIAETKGTGDKFAITAIRPIPFEARSGDNLAELLRCLITIFDRGGRGASSTIALLKCSSGRFGSCLEAIKGEAITELAAFQKGLRVLRLRPRVSKRHSAVRRNKSGETVLRNCSTPTASVGTGQMAQPGQLRSPLRSLGTDAICRTRDIDY
jgi:hypothetical protein